MSYSPVAPAKLVWIAGAGVVSCAGNSRSELWENAKNEKTGIVEGLGAVGDPSIQALSLLSGRVVSFAINAAEQAIQEAGWTSLNPEDGLILATTTGQIEVWDKQLTDFLRGQDNRDSLGITFRHQSLGVVLENVRRHFNHQGPSTLITSACGAATQAIALASMWIRQGKVKRCLVGGTETLCQLTIEGFKSLQLLSPMPATPFDVNRKGINLSEGAGFLALQNERPQNAVAYISGYGMRTDAFHMTGPHPEGRGAFEAMRCSLNRAALEPSDISWVHAHGTGSELNDLAEGLSLRKVFGESMPPVSSTKWLHGHALGASGAIETVLCVEAMRNQTILNSMGVKDLDPKIPVHLSRQTAPLKLRHILKNTLGFGGINASLILSLAETAANV